MSRRRLSPPLIPGFWILVAFVFLVGTVGGYYHVLTRATVFFRIESKTSP